MPAALFDLQTLCRRYFKCEPLVVGDPDVDLGIKVLTDRPAAVGADRLVNAVAAHERYKGALIVVDFGTATTFDIVAANGDYEGGVIAPGANLSAEALHKAAAMLPRVAVERTQAVIGKDTEPAMQSGLFWGYIGLIEGLVARIKEEYGQPMTVIATGGLATLFFQQTPAIDHHRSRSHHPRPGSDPRAQRSAQGVRLVLMDASRRNDELVLLPLGGAGEIGMNFNAYGYRPARRPRMDHRRLRRAVRAGRARRPASISSCRTSASSRS